MIASDNNPSHSHHIIREENDTESIGVFFLPLFLAWGSNGSSICHSESVKSEG